MKATTKTALEAIAGMKVDENTNTAQALALCMAIAKTELGEPQVFTLIRIMAEGIESFGCTFHADNDRDANHKAIGWAYSHGMTRDDVKTRPATQDDIRQRNFHNDWFI